MKRLALLWFVAAASLLPSVASAQNEDMFITVTKVIQNEQAIPGQTAGYSFMAIVHEDVNATQDTYLVMFATFADRLFGDPLLNVEQQTLAYPEQLEYGAQRSLHSGQLESNGILQDVGVMFVLYGQVLYVWWGIGFDAQPLTDLVAIAEEFTFRYNLGQSPSETRLNILVPKDDILPVGYEIVKNEIEDLSND